MLLLTIERLRAGEVRRPEEIGSFILGTSRMMVQSERRIASRREALVARFIDTRIQTAPSSMAALDARRVPACLRALAERDVSAFCCVPQFFYLIRERVLREVQASGRLKRSAFRALLAINGGLRRGLGVNLGPVFFKPIHRALGRACACS